MLGSGLSEKLANKKSEPQTFSNRFECLALRCLFFIYFVFGCWVYVVDLTNHLN